MKLDFVVKTALAQINPSDVVAQTQPVPAPTWQGLLNHLRIIALDCRAAAHADLFEACAMLSEKTAVTQDAHARALCKCLRQAVARPVTFYRPGCPEVSFDEAWLMQALTAKRSGDLDSFAFLIRSRVAHPHQRQIAFLLAGISSHFSNLE